ncbi:hypothetical protein V865_001752 [Kwoniella europaea PYCC6329]|uniref:Uncharacterized protein n=1 Tax=Kwoniella europaea PYCC6329 TaxID=1423913 RepID=A0AAX4KB06_9TREE
MPDLMSLNDEIIDRIGYLLHRDNFILFPSFNPSWANFALEISPTVASDYLAFRSTCRRILSKCGLKGLHISLNVWGRLLKRLVYAPDQVKRVVSMSIDILTRADDRSSQHGQLLPPSFKTFGRLRS